MTTEHEHRYEIDHEHDWHSADYVQEWINHDHARDEDRRPRLRWMINLAPFPKDAPIEVLDVGCGYGILTEETLRAFPNARVTLHDFSDPMLDQARRNLAAYSDRISVHKGDLADPNWAKGLEGRFDMAMSAIAIHNLREFDIIARIYADVRKALKDGGVFLHYERVGSSGGLELNMEWLRNGGFSKVESPWVDDKLAVLQATA